MVEKVPTITDAIAQTMQDLKEIEFDFYAKKEAGNTTLLVAFNAKHKRFLVTVFQNDPVKVLISIPVDLTNAESKCAVVFGRKFISYCVTEGLAAGDIVVTFSDTES